MATQSFFIVNTNDCSEEVNADAIIKGKDKKLLGEGYKKEAPSGRKFFVCKLNDYWIITNEEYKQLKLWQKQNSQKG